MTIEEEAKQFLMQNMNMTEQQANRALKLFKESEYGKLMFNRWTDTAKDYSPALRATWLTSIKLSAQSAQSIVWKSQKGTNRGRD